MPDFGRGTEWYRRPGLILAELIQKAARGEDSQHRNYHRAVVLAVDHDGGLLENDDGSGGIDVVGRDGTSVHYDAVVGPENPRGSVKARVLTDGLDRMRDDADLRVFWPMLPYDQLGVPVAPGEHIYVIFEGTGYEHGLWMSRVSGQDSANAFQGTDSYTAPSAQASAMDSFEPNDPEYQTDDRSASMAPATNPNDLFGG